MGCREASSCCSGTTHLVVCSAQIDQEEIHAGLLARLQPLQQVLVREALGLGVARLGVCSVPGSSG